MSVLDAFYANWKKARETFGAGAPQTGDDFDQSRTLRQLASGLESAAPGSRWTGSAATNYDAANTEHRRVIAELAGLDQRLRSHVNQSAEVVSAGRRDLDSVRQWVTDAANSVPPGRSREQLLLPIASKGLARVSEIITRSNSELNQIGDRIREDSQKYQALGTDQKFAGTKEGSQFVGPEGGDDEGTDGSEPGG